jgi:TonB-linked SusC/RagA family outer membrane protein
MSSKIWFRAALCGLIAVALWSAAPAAVSAQETGTIVGLVIDDNIGQPVGEAVLTIEGTNLRTFTNAQGRYAFTAVPAGTHTLRVERLGYAELSRQVTVTAGATVTANIALVPTALMLGEIIATGVSGGGVERAKVPFSVSRLDAESMPVPSVSPMSMIQGKVPGAVIASTSGRPGQTPEVILRGPQSINASGRSQEPLYVVDGIIMGPAGLADLNPADIESVEIVKGAAASTLYGSRAASGVVSITTRRGVRDGVRFTARSEIGFNDIERDFGIANQTALLLDETGSRFCVIDAFGTATTCARTVNYRQEQIRINNVPGDFASAPVGFPIDPGAVLGSRRQLTGVFLANPWPDTTYNAVQQAVDPKPLLINDFTMAGRVAQTTFFASVGHTRQEGALHGLDGYERYSARVNLGQRIGEHWAVDINSFISRASDDGQQHEEGDAGFFRLTRQTQKADIMARDDFGRLWIRPNIQTGGTQNFNPAYWWENIDDDLTRWRYLVGGNVRYTPVPWMEAHANLSLDRNNNNRAQFRNKGFRTTTNQPATNNGLIFHNVLNQQSLNTSAGTTFRPSLNIPVNTQFTVGWHYEQLETDSRTLQGNLLLIQDVRNAHNITNMQTMASSTTETRQMGLSAGTFLDIMDRYTVDLAIRRDGNSRFGEEHRWQTYGRGSAAWLMAREDWFPIDALSTFTLRASYGTAGNAPSYGAQYETFGISSGNITGPLTLGNPLLRPEVVTEVEVSAELELFERYNLSVAYANSLAKDQILPVPVSISTGFPNQWQNAGDLRNTTWEAALTLPILRGGDFSWTSRASYMYNKPMIENLGRPPFLIGTNLQATGTIIRIEEGLRYGTIWGRQFMTSCADLPAEFQPQCGGPNSAFQLNDEGWLVWVGEGNNTGMGITDNLWHARLDMGDAPFCATASWGMPILIRDPETVVRDGAGNCIAPGTPLLGNVGHTLPKARVGFANEMSFRGVSLYGLFEGAFGQSVWNQARHWSYLDFLSDDLDQRHKSVQTAKPIGYFYRAGPADNASGIGGFYDILAPSNYQVEDASFIKLRELSASYNIGRVGVIGGDWTVTLVGRNLLTWTDYTGWDPEVGIGRSGGEAGSGLVNAIDAFSFPQLRTLSFALQTSF